MKHNTAETITIVAVFTAIVIQTLRIGFTVAVGYYTLKLLGVAI